MWFAVLFCPTLSCLQTYWFYFLILFSSDQDEIWCGVETVQVEHPENLLLSRIYWNKGNNSCFTDCIKNFHIGIHFEVYEWIWFKLVVMTDTVIHFDTGLIDLDTDSRLLEYKKAKTSAPISSTFSVALSLNGIWCVVETWCDEPYSHFFLVNTHTNRYFNIGLYSDIYRPMYFKLVLMIATTKLYTVI